MNLLDRIKDLLKKQGKTQSDLTEYLGISPNVFTGWNNGRNKSYRKWLPQIAEFLGVSVDVLLGNVPALQADEMTDQERTILSIYRSVSEEGKLRIVQAILNIRDEERMV